MDVEDIRRLVFDWSPICQILAYKDESRKSAQGGYIDVGLHQKIFLERKTAIWQYNQDRESQYMYPMANYLYSLCHPYISQAEGTSAQGGVVAGGGGSSFNPITPNGYEWYTIITTYGDYFTDLNGSPNMNRVELIDGLQVNIVFINGQQNTLPIDFTFNSTQGRISLVSNVFNTGDKITISFYKKIT